MNNTKTQKNYENKKTNEKRLKNSKLSKGIYIYILILVGSDTK
jgi:hypothetical protein